MVLRMNERSENTGQLTGQQNLLLAAFDAASNGIIIIDHQQVNDPIIYCNVSFEKLTGYNKGEVIGRNCRFLQDEERLQEGRYTMREALANCNHCVVELRNFRKDGSEFWNEIHISPINDPDGVTTHFIGIQNDISERKLNDILQQRKDDFISAASHELKTPVTSLKASLQLLAKLNPSPERTRVTTLISQANKGVGKVSTLIDELLLSDQLCESKLSLKKTKFPLERLISACCSNIRLENQYHIATTGITGIEVCADFKRIEKLWLRIMDLALPRNNYRISSIGSIKLPKNSIPALASVFTSAPRSLKGTAARSAPTAHRARAHPFGLPCLCNPIDQPE
jgi:PAS domain S-box-containing protein